MCPDVLIIIIEGVKKQFGPSVSKRESGPGYIIRAAIYFEVCKRIRANARKLRRHSEARKLDTFKAT